MATEYDSEGEYEDYDSDDEFDPFEFDEEFEFFTQEEVDNLEKMFNNWISGWIDTTIAYRRDVTLATRKRNPMQAHWINKRRNGLKGRVSCCR
jgi:hypothetical protein